MITVKEKFGATLILDDMLILPNFWDVTVNMEPNPAFADELSSYNMAVDRIQVFIESMLDNSIFISPDHIKNFMDGLPLNGVAHTTPDLPYDHILTMCLYTKFSSIVEGRCIIQNVKLESYQANGVQHSHGLEDGEPETLRNIFAEEDPAFAEYWYDSKIKFFNLTPSGMKLNVSDWEKFDLAFDKKPGDVVSLDTFRRKYKPRDDDDGTDIA